MKNLPLIQARRHLFKLGTVSIITISAGLGSGCGFLDSEQAGIEQRLIQSLHHLERAREIGNAYLSLDSTIDLNSPEQLTEELLEWLNLDSEKTQRLSDKELIEHLSQQIRDDFINENIVILGSWMFSKTEAMLCALADLQQQSEKTEA